LPTTWRRLQIGNRGREAGNDRPPDVPEPAEVRPEARLNRCTSSVTYSQQSMRPAAPRPLLAGSVQWVPKTATQDAGQIARTVKQALIFIFSLLVLAACAEWIILLQIRIPPGPLAAFLVCFSFVLGIFVALTS